MPAAKKTVKTKAKTTHKQKLLSGGNPQIAKGYGDEPVQAYIAAIPGWKQDVGRLIDKLVVRAIPKVKKAVKYNSPMYGVRDGDIWFMSFHCFAKYVKVAFFDGKQLKPMPPGESKQKSVRYYDIYQDDVVDDAQFISWVRQASKLPGEKL